MESIQRNWGWGNKKRTGREQKEKNGGKEERFLRKY
jgi:hypothetical protein